MRTLSGFLAGLMLVVVAVMATSASMPAPIPLRKGGTATRMVAPAADRIYFYDFSGLKTNWLRAHTGLDITGTDLTVTGTGVVTTRTERLMARDFWGSTTEGVGAAALLETATSKANWQVLTFNDAVTAEHAETQIILPNNYTTGTMVVKLIWLPELSHATQAVRIGAQARSFANDETYDAAFGALVEATATVGVAGALTLHYTTLPAMTIAGTPAGSETLALRVQRDATHVGDDYAGKLFLVGAICTFTTTNLSE